ncbi:class I SAM-dependent methyltransferase [Marinimicrobium sp. ARAG 43.8]|uniref:class I SAM-dependent methyltransferase n=1 Tax=Marinimicrobium sp. ARAG 43.8 TaxID=3418719 RepID=UPI003CE8DDC5
MYFNENLSGAEGFDLVAGAYDHARPSYPEKFFENINPGVTLEIGSGSGQATVGLLKVSSRIDCVEPGSNFCRRLREKFSSNKNVTVINETFEEFKPDREYDLVFSASALHWVRKHVAYSKIRQCLKPGGKLVAVWHQPRFSEQVYAAIDATIGQVLPDFYIPRGTHEELALFEQGFRDFEAQNLFSNCEMEVVRNERHVERELLANLVWSYVNVKELSDPGSVRSEFDGKILKLNESDCFVIDFYLSSRGEAV